MIYLLIIKHLSFENVENFKYLGVTVTKTNDIRDEIKVRINMGNTCYLLENSIVPAAFQETESQYGTIVLHC